MKIRAAEGSEEDDKPLHHTWDWLAIVIGRLSAFLLKLLKISWRADSRQFTKVDQQVAAGVPVIAVFWHGSYLPLFAMASGRSIIVFTSQSFRGKVIAYICEAFGYTPSFLPPGRRGYHHMRAFLSEHSRGNAEPAIVGLAVDGPLGPRHKVKLGALHMATRMGAVLMPIRVTSRPNWTIGGRWDRFKIPLPLAQVKLHVGEPITLPPTFGSDQEEVGRLCRLVRDQLNGSHAMVE